MAKILLVDDEPEVAGLMSDWLRLRGYDVLRAQDGVEALRMARSDVPDLILLDAFMPGLDGLETGRRLRAQPETRHMPIVLIAGEDAAGAQLDRLMAGASDAVTRPVMLDDLGARMRALLAGDALPEDRAGSMARAAVGSAVSSLPCGMAWLFAPDEDGGWLSRAAAAPGHPDVTAPVRIPPGQADWWCARPLQTRIAEFNLPLDDVQTSPDDPIIQACVRLGLGYVTLIPLADPGHPAGLLLLASQAPLDLADESARRALTGVTNQAGLALDAPHVGKASGRGPAENHPHPSSLSLDLPPPLAGEGIPIHDGSKRRLTEPSPEPETGPLQPGEEAPPDSEETRFEALREATLAALSATSLDAALQTIVNQSSKALNVKLTALLLRPQRGGETVVIHRAAGLRARRLEDVVLPLPGSLTDEALKARQPVIFERGSAKKAEIGLIQERVEMIVSTAAAAPLIVQGEAAGALLAINRWDGPFAAGEVDLLYSLANLASIAISGARLAADFEGRARGLAVLGRAAEAVSAQPMPALLDSITRLVMDGLAARWCAIRLLDNRSGDLATLARRIDHRRPGQSARRVTLSEWPSARRVIETGAIIRIVASRQETRGGQGMHSLLLYPVPAGGKAAGVAVLGHPSESLAFSEEHVARCRGAVESWAAHLSGPDWAAAAGRLAESLLIAVGAPWCSIFALDEGGQSLTLAAETGHVAFGLSSQEIHALDQDSLRRSVLSTRMTVTSEPGDERLSRADRAMGWPFDTGAAIVTPIMARGEAIGLIEAADDSPDRFYADHDRLVLRAIANLVGGVLGRAGEQPAAPKEARKPADTVMGYADLAPEESRQPAAEARPETPEMAERKIREVSALIDGARAAQEAIGQPLRQTVASLENVARAAMQAMQPTADQAGVALASFFAEFLPDIYIDRERVFLVIQALLDNAIRHAPQGSRVTMTIRETDSMLQVEVADKGAGIPPEEQAGVWEKSHPAGGAVGLAAVRQVVEAHGGRAWLVSTPGEGSTFAFTLPKPEVSGMGDFIPSF